MFQRYNRLILSLILSFWTSSLIYHHIYLKKPFPLSGIFSFYQKFFLSRVDKNVTPTPLKQRVINERLIFSPTLSPSYHPSLSPTKKLSPTTHVNPTIEKIPTPTLKKYFPPTLTFSPPTLTFTPTPSPTQIFTKKISSSKLSIFIINTVTAGADKIIKSCPRIVKVIDPQGNDKMIQAIKNYKNNCPGGVTVVRFYPGTSGIKYNLVDNPESSAENFFNQAIAPNLNILGPDSHLFDYLQMPNEFENTPEWWGEEKMRWNGRFWLRLTTLNKNAGIKTCVGSIPVGNTTGNDLSYIINELREMKNMGAALCYHSYTFHYSTDVNEEINLSLRYRQYYSFFAQSAPDLLSMPVILSEGGVAENGDPYAGYLISNSIERYQSWLRWFDQEIKKDSYVIGVTLFQIGNNSDWRYFNLEPISDWLANYIGQK